MQKLWIFFDQVATSTDVVLTKPCGEVRATKQKEYAGVALALCPVFLREAN